MSKKVSIFYSGKFLIFNIALFSLIIGFVLSSFFYISCANNNQTSSNYSQVLAQDTTNNQEGIRTLQDIQANFNAVANKALPVVVEINTIEVIREQGPHFFSPFDFFFSPDQEENQQKKQQYKQQQQQQPQQQPDQEFRRPGLGSGVIVRDNGNTVFVVTNFHVVGTADRISVRLNDGREFEAKIVGKDQRTDLALVSFEAQGEFPVAKFANHESLKVGDWALAVGNPFGFESTMTVGIISAIGRNPEGSGNVSTFVDYIQTDAAINPGNSGGGLFNIQAELVGINTWIASQTGGNIGLGFAIPVYVVQKVIDDFIRVGKVVYGWLGVQVADDNLQYFPEIIQSLNIEGEEGGLVLNTFIGSPADRAGIKPGDFITKIGNTDIEDSNHLTRIVGTLAPGQDINFSLIRYGRPLTITVRIEARAEEGQIQSNNNLWPGMIPFPLNDELRKQFGISNTIQGAFIAQVVEGSPAGTGGFRQGDIVTRIANNKTNNLVDFYRSINESQGEIVFRTYRQGNEILIGLEKKR
jgi:serine protease Do